MAQATLPAVASKPHKSVTHPSWLLTTTGICAVLLLVALALPIAWGHVYVADDLGEFHLPARAFYAEALAHGQSFHWWPQLFGGFYLTGEGQAGTYHPLHWALYRWLPLPLAFDLEVLLSYPWMLLGTYLWLRRRLPRADAALFGAMLFTFCGFNLLHLPHVNAVAVVAQLPWLLLAMDVVVRDPRPRWRLLATAAIPLLTASQLLLGYPQYVWFSLLLEVGYACWLLRHGPPAWLVVQRGGRHVLRRGSSSRTGLWLTLTAATGIGFLLAAIQLLPTLDVLSTSVRKDAGTAFAEWGSLHPFNVLQLVAPYLFENRVVGLNTHELGLYAGCVPLMLCAWLWMRRREWGALRPLIVAAAGVAVLALWMAFGEYGFIYRVQAWLPVVGKFRFPCRMIVLFHLAMAVLAAAALALLAVRQPARMPIRSTRYTMLWALVGASVVVAIVAVVAWPEHVAGWPLIVAGPLLFGVTAILVWLADRNNSTALLGLVVLAAADLGLYGLSYSVYGRTEPLATFAAPWPAPPPGTTTRLLADRPTHDERAPRTGNRCLLSGWNRVDGYAGLEPARRLDYRKRNAQQVAGVGWVCHPVPEGRSTIAQRFIAGNKVNKSSPHRPVGTTDAPPGTGTQQLSTVPLGRTELAQFSNPAVNCWAILECPSGTIQQPPAPLPPARMVGSVQTSRDPARDIQRIDPATTALVEPGFNERHALADAVAGNAEIEQQASGRLVVATQSAAPNLLVINQSWHSGWHARIDGQPAAVERVYGDFFGCVVPPGSHRVQFEFQPASLRHGAMLSAAGLACLFLGVVWLAQNGRAHDGDKEPKI